LILLPQLGAAEAAEGRTKLAPKASSAAEMTASPRRRVEAMSGAYRPCEP